MKVTGKCHCGAISYKAEVNPKHVIICHCTDCQEFSGSAYRTIAPARGDTFELLSGTPKHYVKTADSGTKRVQAFCPDCGTSLYSTSDEPNPEIIALRPATLDYRDDLPPQNQIWTSSAQPWSGDLSGLRGFPKQFGS